MTRNAGIVRPMRRQLTRAEYVTAAIGAVQAGLNLYERVTKTRNKVRALRWHTVTVSETEPIWWDLQDRILTLIPEADQRSLSVMFQRDLALAPIAVAYEGSRTHTIRVEGHDVRVTVLASSDGRPVAATSILDDSAAGVVPASEDNSSRLRKPRALQFDCPTIEARHAVIGWLGEVAEARRRREHPPAFHIANRWGGWSDLPPAARRDPATVVLADGIMDSILADIGTFLDAREWYEERGLPWHRGWLLYGPPGSGKSSIPRAVATRFNLDLWYIPLGDMATDADLLNLVSNIRTGGVLLLEDVDVFQQARSRDAEPGDRPESTLSGVLNALDGVATPPGLIKFVTTNNRDALDDALIRPGRCDREEYIGPVVGDQLNRLFQLMYGGHPALPALPTLTEADGVSAAAVLEACKVNQFDPFAAAAAVAALTQGVSA